MHAQVDSLQRLLVSASTLLHSLAQLDAAPRYVDNDADVLKRDTAHIHDSQATSQQEQQSEAAVREPTKQRKHAQVSLTHCYCCMQRKMRL